MHLFDLTGRRALVTGSSMGIGYSLALGLIGAGAKVVLNARNRERLHQAMDSLKACGSDVDCMCFDVTDSEAVRAAIDEYEAAGNSIDILVNNAGMQHRAPLAEYPAAMFDLLMRTNVNSAFHVGQAVANHMIMRGSGKIINIASVQTLLARPGVAPYMASKGAIANLTRGMATEWARFGLNCNAIAPGYFKTPLTSALSSDPEFCSWLEKRTPQGRWGNLEDLHGACIYLASNASGFVNGHTLYVDGGITACM
ncbi:MAG: SDR family oxidoreductase [Roseovarius sp.]|nr:SDR family oxidoreductase [Roseovarius sp.]MCY4208868.1 SDR family oxidoreductase [Roseovarius sp.]MCY4291840.1 SDR family oxidoreductase [Roseovarius sp.]MCY4315813.1 SDR family oxidoreductase [Roseovarius sp.]